MCPETDYAPCPDCAADNVTYRSTCWRCGATLPYSLGLDGCMHRNIPSPRKKPPVEILLDTAKNLALEREGEKTRSEHPSKETPAHP